MLASGFYIRAAMIARAVGRFRTLGGMSARYLLLGAFAIGCWHKPAIRVVPTPSVENLVPTWRHFADAWTCAVVLSDTGPSIRVVGHGRVLQFDRATGEVQDVWSLPQAAAAGCRWAASETVVATWPWSGAGELVGLFPDGATVRWRTPTAASNVGAASNALVVLATIDAVDWRVSSLVAVDATSGVPRWKIPLPAELEVEDIWLEGSAVHVWGLIRSARHRVLASFDATGAERWKLHAPVLSSAAFRRGRIVVAVRDEGLRVVDTLDGAVRRVPALVNGDTIATTENVAYASTWSASGRSGLVAIDLASGPERWRYHATVGLDTDPVVAVDAVYVATPGSVLHALDLVTGRSRWAWSIGQAFSVVDAGDVVVAARRDGTIVGFVRQPTPAATEHVVMTGTVEIDCGESAGLEGTVGDLPVTTDAHGRFKIEMQGRGALRVQFRGHEVMVTLDGRKRYEVEARADLCE